MNYDKLLRVLVCLALVCCLLLNVAAMPVQATDLGSWIMHQVGTDIGVTAILEGLGIFRDVASDYFDELRANVKNYLVSGDYVKDDLMEAYYFQAPLPQAASFYAFSKAMIEVVRQYVFDDLEIVSFQYNDFALSDSCSSYSDAISYAVNCPRAFTIVSNGKRGVIVTTDDSRYVYFENGSLTLNGSYSNYSVYWEGNSAWQMWGDNFTYTNCTEIATAPLSSTDKPLSLGVVCPSSTLFNAAYPQWLEHQRELEDGTTETVVQIGLGNTQAETESLTQEQVWSGQGTLTVPDQGQVSDSVILPGWLQQGIENLRLGLLDILDTLISLPVSIAEALAKVFIPSKDYISAKVEAIRGEFGFIDSVIATGEFIRDSISGASGPPVIYVDLGRAPSGNYGSQRVLLTDFSWYAPYKAQVDTVLSAALWAFFGWRVFLKLPGIIGGESGYISDVFFPSSSGRSGSDDKKKGGKG